MTDGPKIPGSTSLSELRQSNSDPFNKFNRIVRFFVDDAFRSICLGFIFSSLILTMAMIFDAKLSNGPIPQHGAVFSSDSRCSKFGKDFLKKTRNSFDTAILTSLCLLATHPDAVSFGGGGQATIYRIDEPGSTYIDFIGRDNTTVPHMGQPGLPTFMRGLRKIKDLGDDRFQDGKYTGASFSELRPDYTNMHHLVELVKNHIENGLDGRELIELSALSNILQHLTVYPDSFYEPAIPGQPRTIYDQLLTHIGSEGLKRANTTESGLNTSLNITNGALESRSSISVLTLATIDTYLSDNLETSFGPKDPKFPSLIASSMYEAGRLFDEKPNLNLEKGAKEAASNVQREKMGIRLRRNETFDSPFRLDQTYKSAFVSVIGDDNQVISIVLTTGKECDNTIEFELDGKNVSFCRSSFSGLRENIFPSPVIYRPKCGVCGRHTILNGDLSAVINFGARSIRHSSLLDSTFTERVSVSSNGTVLVEAGMPKQEPEMFAALKDADQKVDVIAPMVGIGWAGALEWRNDEVHAISDERDTRSWPAYVF